MGFRFPTKILYSSSMRNIYIEYPKTKWGNDLTKIFSVLTYVSILTVVIWSYFKNSEYYFRYIYITEFFFSFLFFMDYFVRLYLSKFSWRYIRNIFSITDVISFLPFFIGLFIWFSWYSEIFNIFRLCRVFRIFKVGKYWLFLKELRKAVEKNLYKYKIAFTLFFIVWLIGSFLLYSVENGNNPMFAHIPDAMWWAVVTMATVWYWDKVPITILWKILSTFIIIFWPIFLSIITSITIVTFLDVVKYLKKWDGENECICHNCLTPWHKVSDNFCKVCGTKLNT